MRGLLLAIYLALPIAAAATPTVATDALNRSVTADMLSLPVHIGGRAKIAPSAGATPKGARTYVHEWPGVYFEAAFRGDRVVLKFDDAANEYRLLVDDLAPITLAQPGRVEVRVGGLVPGRHRLRLEKVTESVDRVGTFGGFYVPRTAKALPVRARARQIEFIGASSMTGYGNRSASRQCTTEEVRLRTDTQHGFPARVAKHYDADYQINAISGRGAVRNYGGVLPDRVLPRVYPLTLPSGAARYADPLWRPGLFIIALSNDAATPLKPGEAWRTDAELAADYAAGFGAFVAALHKRSPSAAMLILWFDVTPATDSRLAQYIREAERTITAAARKAGVREIAFLPLVDLGYESSACDHHLSLRDHARMAAWMIRYLDAHPALRPARFDADRRSKRVAL